jgi:hypothetical protein
MVGHMTADGPEGEQNACDAEGEGEPAQARAAGAGPLSTLRREDGCGLMNTISSTSIRLSIERVARVSV